jgi:hypothetical protein
MQTAPHAPPTPASLAAACRALEAALQSLPARMHASWQAPLAARWPVLDVVADEAARGRLAARLLVDECGGMPPADAVMLPEASVATADVATLLRNLCVLALACRPGALRCCVEREAKAALMRAVGNAGDALWSLSGQGRPVSSESAGWLPLEWACLGYVDWLLLPAGCHRLLRRLLAVSLPCGLLGMARRRGAHRDVAPAAALRMLRDAGGAWPC